MNRIEDSCEEEATHFAFGQLEQKIHDQKETISELVEALKGLLALEGLSPFKHLEAAEELARVCAVTALSKVKESE